MGTLGGFIGWLLQETLIHYQARMVDGVCTALPITTEQQVILALCTGGIIGLFLGSVDGIVEANAYKLRNGIIVGLVAGFFVGGIGLNLGGYLYGALGGTNTVPAHASVFSFIQQMVARSVGLTLLGVAVGFGSSISSMSLPRMRNGAIGGLLGGLVGGFLFDILPNIVVPVTAVVGDVGCHEVAGPSRAVGFIAIGAFTGFFVGLVQELLKDAWVKVLAGRNEGKDFILGKPMNILGRDEKCDVPLYGDTSVGVQHAAIRADGYRHVIIDGKTPAGTMVNGQHVPSGAEQLLRDGDMIQIGSYRILFREKATASKYIQKSYDEPKSKSPASSVSMPSHLCPYCGAPKDVNGRCLCNIDAGAGIGLPLGGIAASPGTGPTYGAPSGVGSLPAYAAPGVGALPVRMIALGGTYSGQGFVLGGPNMTVGRDENCDISLSADATVSRSHARLVPEPGGMVVYDNSSSNGTYVNGLRVTAPITVVSGDIVQFGSSKFKLE
jgi:pSer/pThr/pTyr-binding forkhead associated (FHA) protein